MTDLPPLAPPWTRIPTIHETTDLFTEPTMAALDARYTGGFGTLVRDTATFTSSSLADGAQQTSTVNMATGFEVYDITADRACRVRLYRTTAQRDADAARGAGTFPTDTGPDHGCFLEVIFDTADSYTITSGGNGFLDSGIAVPITVDNLSGSTHTVIVDFTYLVKE